MELESLPTSSATPFPQLEWAPYVMDDFEKIRYLRARVCRHLAQTAQHRRDQVGRPLPTVCAMDQTTSFEALCFGDASTLCRPCVDCGLYTGRYCDYCHAADRLPDETWAPGQMTPLCSNCDDKRHECHFCAGKSWCTPPPSGMKPESAESMQMSA